MQELRRRKTTKTQRAQRILSVLCVFVVFLPAVVKGSSAAGKVSGSVALVKTKTKDFSNVAIWLEPISTKQGPAQARSQMLTIKQKGKQLIPHVLIAPVGQQVDFPNEDPFPHNIFSSSEVRRFDLGIYQQGESRTVLLSRPGIVTVHCNIHPQMEAFIVVVGTPYYSTSNKKGEFQIEDVPPGNYRLKVWHERALAEKLNALNRQVSVTASGANLGTIQIDESGYSETPHKNKEGKDYD
jgi:plastocyanin